MSAILSYLRLPVLASSALAAIGSGLLYFKQKYDLGSATLVMANKILVS